MIGVTQLARESGQRDLFDCEASPDAADRMMTDSLVAGGLPTWSGSYPSNAHDAAVQSGTSSSPQKPWTFEPCFDDRAGVREASSPMERLVREAAARDFEGP